MKKKSPEPVFAFHSDVAEQDLDPEFFLYTGTPVFRIVDEGPEPRPAEQPSFPHQKFDPVFHGAG